MNFLRQLWGGSRTLRWTTVAGVASALVLIADVKGALAILNPWMPALRGWVLDQVEAVDRSQGEKIDSVRRQLLTERIKGGEKYRLDLAVQKLDLMDQLVGLPLGPKRQEINRLLAATDAAIAASNQDDATARCELDLLFNRPCLSPVAPPSL